MKDLISLRGLNRWWSLIGRCFSFLIQSKQSRSIYSGSSSSNGCSTTLSLNHFLYNHIFVPLSISSSFIATSGSLQETCLQKTKTKVSFNFSWNPIQNYQDSHKLHFLMENKLHLKEPGNILFSLLTIRYSAKQSTTFIRFCFLIREPNYRKFCQEKVPIITPIFKFFC